MLSPEDNPRLNQWLANEGRGCTPAEKWRYCTTSILSPDVPLLTHRALLAKAYGVPEEDALLRCPVWSPDTEHVQHHNVTHFLANFQGDAEFQAALRQAHGDPALVFNALYDLSIRDPEALLLPVLRDQLRLPFHEPPSRALVVAQDPDKCRWLPGARMNIAWCALHRQRGLLPAPAPSPAISSTSSGRTPVNTSSGNTLIRGPSSSGRPGNPQSSSSSERPALVWVTESAPSVVHEVGLVHLRALALNVAASLRALGLKPGACVAVMLPLTPASVAVYLGIVLAGCAAVSIADSFAAHEVEARLRISGSHLIVAQDCVMRGGKALPLYPRVAEAASGARCRAVVIPASAAGAVEHAAAHAAAFAPGTQLREGDLSWSQFLGLTSKQQAVAAALLPPSARPAMLHVAAPDEPTNILFSSGTTGEPKAIVWTHTIPLRAAFDGWAHQGIRPGDVVAWPTSLGWMMGPWLIYAALLNGATIALYEGAPLGRDFGVFLASARVSVLGLVPSIVKAWRGSNCMQGLRWPCLRVLSSTGEASSPEDYFWLYALTRYQAPVIEYCGGTEIGGSFITGTTLQPQCCSAFSTPCLFTRIALLVRPDPSEPNALGGASSGPKYTVQSGQYKGYIISHHRTTGAPPAVGEIVVVPPTVGGSQRLLNKSHYEVYYAGMPSDPDTGRPLRRHGDELQRKGAPVGVPPALCYYTALGRVDDTMNLGGIKVSSVELERAVTEGVPSVAEAAAIAIPTPGGGPEQLVLFLVLHQSKGPQQGTPSLPDLLRSCNTAIRSRLNPLFKAEQVHLVTSLPRNASNKVMRRVLRDQLMKQAAPKAKL